MKQAVHHTNGIKYLESYITDLKKSYEESDKNKVDKAISKLLDVYQTNNLESYIDRYIQNLKRTLDNLDKKKIEECIEMLLEAYNNGNKIFIMGNGGSASNASHIACDIGKGTLSRVYDDHKKRFKIYSLTDNVAMMTAFANDLSFDDIFVQQIRNLIEKDDILMVLSGSGNSINLIKAVEYAKLCKAKSIGFLGFKNGGKLGGLVDCAIIADSDDYGPCEDIQQILDHIISVWLARVRINNDE
jgi:D-sedoheptulose 7-phosphate isomerase